MQRLATPDEVVSFWREAGPEKWFSKDETFDQICRDRFLPTYEAAARGDLNEWELDPGGCARRYSPPRPVPPQHVPGEARNLQRPIRSP